jgi:hypothetical protein
LFIVEQFILGLWLRAHEKNLYQLIGTLELSKSANAEKLRGGLEKLVQNK